MIWKTDMRYGLVLAAAITAFAAAPAFATGNLGCAVEDAVMDLNIESVITHGLGEPIVSLRGELIPKDTAVAALFGAIPFDRSHVSQYWLEGRDLRLYVYRDLDAKTARGAFDLVIRTEAIDDEGGFEGRYRLSLSYSSDGETGEGHPMEKEGPITCFAG